MRRLVTIQLEGDVNNDGFDGFFGWSGADVVATIAALELIGAHRTAAIVRRAAAKFPNGVPPVDPDARRAVLLDLVYPNGDAFEAEDAAFLRYEEDLESLVAAYEAKSSSSRDIREP